MIDPAATIPDNHFTATPFDLHDSDERGSLYNINQIVQANDLSVVFQPIVHIETLRVFAYEALTRCRVKEYANPTALFERATSERCVGRLGRMVREVALPLCAGRPVFLNVHPAELDARWLVRPDDPMYFHDHDVFLEITEAVPFAQFELCRDVLREVRSRGNISLVVDDLGAGYSNLKHIVDLEPSLVKLDRGLVADVTLGSRQQRLITNIVRLCKDMGAQVVAEGVETVDEWRALRDTGVHFAQGFLFARPGYPLPPVSVPPEIEDIQRSIRPPRRP
ncbi:MAG: EAL domain-containing protein [Polyangiales bacterium]